LIYRALVGRFGETSMTLFVVISSHSPDQCPISNEKARKAYGADPGPMMALAKKLGVRPIVGPLVSAEHRTFVVMEAPKIEAVREFIVQSGLVQWNVNEIIHVIPQEEALKEIELLKPVY